MIKSKWSIKKIILWLLAVSLGSAIINDKILPLLKFGAESPTANFFVNMSSLTFTFSILLLFISGIFYLINNYSKPWLNYLTECEHKEYEQLKKSKKTKTN